MLGEVHGKLVLLHVVRDTWSADAVVTCQRQLRTQTRRGFCCYSLVSNHVRTAQKFC